MNRTRRRTLALTAALVLLVGSAGATVARAAAVAEPVACTAESGVLSCPLPTVTSTVTDTETATVTETATSTVTSTTTAPGTTVTTTAPASTVTVTATPTTTSTTASPTSTSSSPTTTTTPPPVPTGPWSAPVFTDDFSVAKPAGFASTATSDPKWTGYNFDLSTPRGNDTQGKSGDQRSIGGYYRAEQGSVHDGVLDITLQNIGGKPRVFAPIPKIPTALGGQGNVWPHNGLAGGRYSVDITVPTAIPGYKVAMLLWADTGLWGDGELDFPEGDFKAGGGVTAWSHNVNPGTNNSGNCYGGGGGPVWAGSGKHTYVMEWIPSTGVNVPDASNPGRWTTYIDGVKFKETTDPRCVPIKSMHWVFQVETEICWNPQAACIAPSASTIGHVLFDNVSIQKYQP